MDRRKRKKQTSTIVTRRTGIACLSLILAFQLLPLNVLANDSSQQVSPTDSAAQIELTDSANQVDPADTAAQIELTVFVQQLDTAETYEQNNTEDPAETPESLEEEVSEGVPADNDAASVESESTLDNELNEMSLHFYYHCSSAIFTK